MLIEAPLGEQSHLQIEPGVHKLLANYQTRGGLQVQAYERLERNNWISAVHF